MKLAYLLILVALSGCGSSDDDSDDDTDGAVVNGTNLAALPLFVDACIGTVNADFATDDETFGMITASFKTGDKLVMASTTSNSADNTARVYRSDPDLTGVKDFDVPEDKLTYDCPNYESGVAIMSNIELFTDEQRTASACTLNAGLIFHGSALKGTSSVLSANDGYDGSVAFSALEGSTCPPDVDLYFYMPAVTQTIGNKITIEPFFPIFNAFYPAP